MNTGLREMSDLTDSREMLESKPNRTLPFILILLTFLVVLAGVWSIFGKIDTVSTAYGLIRSDAKAGTVPSLASGVVKQAQYKEGEQVEEGQILLKFDSRENSAALNNNKSELDRIKKEITYYDRLKQSIRQKENLFTNINKQESFYYNRISQYLLSYENKRQELEASLFELDKQYDVIEQEEEITVLSIRQEEQNTKRQQREYNKRSEALKEYKEENLAERKQLSLLHHAVAEGGNLPMEADDKSKSEFARYQADLEPWKNSLVGVESIDLPILQQIKTYRHQTFNQIQSRIDTVNARLQNINNSLQALSEFPEESTSSEQLKLKNEQFMEQKDKLKQQRKTMEKAGDALLAQIEAETQVQVDMNLDALEKQHREIERAIQILEMEREKLVLKASSSGTVHIIKEVGAGDFVEMGEKLFVVIPNDEPAYRVSLFIPNAQIGNIKIGNIVDLSVDAFPKQSYGMIKGVVLSIGSDSVVQGGGESGYIVEASIQRSSLLLRENEKGEIKVGMTVQATIITGSQSILDYILGKIDFNAS